MLWATAATKHAVSWFHLDDHGLGTVIHIETGSKFWVIGRPKAGHEQKAYKNFGAAESFSKWEPESAGTDFWDHEGVVLNAGDTLFVFKPSSIHTAPLTVQSIRYMQPNTFHYVVTLENSVTIGRHFYCASTISQTVIGVIHTFLMGHGITNVEHNNALQTVLRRQMGAWYMRFNESSYSYDDHHTPNFSTPEGLHDLMALGNLLELGRVLDRRTYTDKGINKKEGAEIIAARRWYRILQTMFACKFQIRVGKRITNVASVFKRSLVEFAAAILTYKRDLDNAIDKRFTTVALEKEMSQFFKVNYPEVMVCWKKLVKEKHKYLLWSSDEIKISRRKNLALWDDEYYNFRDLYLYDIPEETELEAHALETIPEEMDVDDVGDAAGDGAERRKPRSKAMAKPRSQGPPVRSSKRIQERAASVGESN
jgi:hypothetical protein